MSEALKKIDSLKRSMILEFLDECTPEQLNTFKRMYSHANLELPLTEVVQNMAAEKLDWALRQCETTVLKNKQKTL